MKLEFEDTEVEDMIRTIDKLNDIIIRATKRRVLKHYDEAKEGEDGNS